MGSIFVKCVYCAKQFRYSYAFEPLKSQMANEESEVSEQEVLLSTADEVSLERPMKRESKARHPGLE